MHFSYNFYRKWFQSQKSIFQVTGCSSLNRSAVCHSTSNVCVVGTSTSSSNNRKEQWKYLNVHITIGRCHLVNGTENIKTCWTELQRVSFFLVFRKDVSCPLHYPPIHLPHRPFLLDQRTLFQHQWLFDSLCLSLLFFFNIFFLNYSRRSFLKTD